MLLLFLSYRVKDGYQTPVADSSESSPSAIIVRYEAQGYLVLGVAKSFRSIGVALRSIIESKGTKDRPKGTLLRRANSCAC